MRPCRRSPGRHRAGLHRGYEESFRCGSIDRRTTKDGHWGLAAGARGVLARKRRRSRPLSFGSPPLLQVRNELIVNVDAPAKDGAAPDATAAKDAQVVLAHRDRYADYLTYWPTVYHSN